MMIYFSYPLKEKYTGRVGCRDVLCGSMSMLKNLEYLKKTFSPPSPFNSPFA